MHFRIGGPARFYAEPKTLAELKKALAFAKARRVKFYVIGAGTNILAHDRGFEGIVIHPRFEQIKVMKKGLRVGAGVLVSDVLSAAARAGLSGLEWAGGLPGTAGGALRGNAGAFGGQMQDAVKSVTSLDVKTLKKKTRTAKQCAFAYRTSWFKAHEGKEIILEMTFALQPSDRKMIEECIRKHVVYRASHHPMEYPTIGSTFKNIPFADLPVRLQKKLKHVVKMDPFPVIPVGFLISEVGLRGVSAGGAQISPRHSNFIVNVLGASSSDVEQLIGLVKHKLNGKYKIVPEEEIMRLG